MVNSTTLENLSPLVSVEEVYIALQRNESIILDASWHLPSSGRSAKVEFDLGHIPTAQFFDLDEVCDHASSLPHMFPAESYFRSSMEKLGITRSSSIIVYDSSGKNFSAARAWWMLKAFGCSKVFVIDGGLPAWLGAGFSITPLITKIHQGEDSDFSLNRLLVTDKQSVISNLKNTSVQIVDARPSGRFLGTDPEPRPGLRSGHIPTSINIPYTEMVTQTGRMLTQEQLKSLFASKGVRLSNQIFVTCGSGVSACAVALGLTVAGAKMVSVYDGSWAEWGADHSLPVTSHSPVSRVLF